MTEVIQSADYIASTEPIDLANRESFFWTQSVTSGSGYWGRMLPRCARAQGCGVLGPCAGAGAMSEEVSGDVCGWVLC